MNKRNFRSAMERNGYNLEKTASALGITRQSLCNKVNGRNTEFRQSEIEAIRDLWGLSAQETADIFFSHSVN